MLLVLYIGKAHDPDWSGDDSYSQQDFFLFITSLYERNYFFSEELLFSELCLLIIKKWSWKKIRNNLQTISFAIRKNTFSLTSCICQQDKAHPKMHFMCRKKLLSFLFVTYGKTFCYSLWHPLKLSCCLDWNACVRKEEIF